MATLPDDAFVVRGGLNQPENFLQGSAVSVRSDGMLDGVSVNAAANRTVEELTAPNDRTGYPGIPNRRIGVTTVGAVRAAGGAVTPAPSANNAYHATVSGLTPETASELFQPTQANPNSRR
jgi:hypothetical protein